MVDRIRFGFLGCLAIAIGCIGAMFVFIFNRFAPAEESYGGEQGDALYGIDDD